MLHFKNATFADGSIGEIWVDQGLIYHIGKLKDVVADQTIDCAGLTLLPGLIDLHTHLRDPGYEYKEDLASGTRAAAKGGFTSVCCMANTNPVNDCLAITQYITEKAAKEGVVHVYPIGAITHGMKGESLSEMGDMKRGGIVAVSDDGKPVLSSQMMRVAMRYAQAFDLPIASHCEDASLVGDGVMHEGAFASYLGLQGIPASAEDTMTARDCLLALETGARLHICHVSTKTSVEIIRHFKKAGAHITCETTPHYIVGTDKLCANYNSNAKVNPPLREAADCEAIIKGLLDGTIDCIATDHAPHHIDEKRVEFALAASGISGFETALSLCYTHLVNAGHMSLPRLVELMCSQPAALFSLPGGKLTAGQAADLILFDPKEEWTIDSTRFVSKGKNTPFDGFTVQGMVKQTFVAGNCVWPEVIA